MTDIVDRATRSRMMAGIRGKNTNPERIVRSHLHRAGFRFRLHPVDLPGRPDIVLPRWGVVILVHGCFWHRHHGCRYAATPKTNREFWVSKFRANVARDASNIAALRRLGWRVIVVWECRTGERSLDALVRRIQR
ncbi:MAG: DNA mismatch endonuclease Vsr [Gemmatimonadales bacterium]|nr:DNA mismatch endonuclease Vsr [Gemmatimonadales bacterium]